MYDIIILIKWDVNKEKSAWAVRIREVSADMELITETAERYSVEVLVTNMPFATEDAVNLRRGWPPIPRSTGISSNVQSRRGSA